MKGPIYIAFVVGIAGSAIMGNWLASLWAAAFVALAMRRSIWRKNSLRYDLLKSRLLADLSQQIELDRALDEEIKKRGPAWGED